VDSTIQFLSIIIIILTLVLYVMGAAVLRRRREAFSMRAMPAYDALPMMIGAAIEANRPVHLSSGSTGLGTSDTLLSLATAELFYRALQRAAISPSPPLLTTSDTTFIPLGHDILRRAYASRQFLSRFRATNVRWYPAGPRSLAFAAALTANLGEERVGANILVGSFGPELALIAEAAVRRGQPLIAASDQLDGQAVAYALADQPLIGEELFVAGAYLGTEAGQRSTALTLDVLRWGLIALILVLTVFAAAGGQ
jgi:hypothetical protein